MSNTWNDDVISLLQEDVYGRLANDVFFSDIPVLLARKGLVDSDVELALSGLNEKDGKAGSCVIVLMPEVDAPEGESPGPVIEVVQSFQVIVRPLIADDTASGGVGKNAEQIGVNVLNLLHRYVPRRVGNVLTADKKPMRPLQAPVQGEVHYLVVLRLRTGLDRVRKVMEPQITPGETITLTCGTAGAEIYWTADGSYPGPANEAATLYSGPITLPPETVFPIDFQAVAYLEGMIPSDCNWAPIADE
ncbi:chitobiase/beta-hexosaminidase C-terminal domain-containing protein [Verrucomicrobium spinosum]|uniref:chitobiase/beta-hexosaminidase C-terminal domain-containing protein n=1 Tax=Verrucomicrobium spinosum TaxID=2736 RepID=UPI00017466A2|nr:chitobiase/beta-hexosaminidase C-terminal domain-containing protein [Verrucomicrobium spinosum]